MTADGCHISLRLQAPEDLEEGGKAHSRADRMGTGGVQKIATFTGGFILVMLCLDRDLQSCEQPHGPRHSWPSVITASPPRAVGITVTRYKMTGLCHLRFHGGRGGRALSR